MKKLLTSLLLAATLIVSCDKNEDPNTPPPAEYKGTKYTGDTIVSATFNGNVGSFTSEETIAYVDKAASSVSVTLAKACFTKDIPYVAADYQMPSLDIVLPNIPVAQGTRYVAENVVPTMLDGEPYGDDIIKSIDDVMVYIDGDYVTVNFDCTVFINLTGKGSENFTFGIEFTNYEAPIVTTPTIPETTADQDYLGNVFTYDPTITDGDQSLYYSTTNDIKFSWIESSNTLVARDFKFTDSDRAPLMTMVIENTSGDNLKGYVFVYGAYNTTVEVTDVEVSCTSDEGLTATIDLIYEEKAYEISFYNQNDVPSDRE